MINYFSINIKNNKNYKRIDEISKYENYRIMNYIFIL
jgi:hypothetical protein